MTTVPMITTPAALADLADRLRQEPLIACDLEADSLHHYQEKVCLIQFSTPEFSALVDPLAVTDLDNSNSLERQGRPGQQIQPHVEPDRR